MFRTLLIVLLLSATSCSSTYYIVRHAEKEAPANVMTSDVPLSAAGKERAEALKGELLGKNIRRIYSTNYIRTRETAQPLSGATGVAIETYDPRDSTILNRLKSLDKGHVLVVGHSNTVDDLVNGLTGKKLLQDLPDTQYGDLFVVKKRGKNYRYVLKHFGK
ncbi:MAG TPA: phosphoglycerate mutase family protein [Chitinophagaceae bacterium]